MIIFTLEFYFLRSLHLVIRRIMRCLVMGVTTGPPGPGEPMTGWFFLKDKCCKVICLRTMRLSGGFKRCHTGRNCQTEKNKTPHHHKAPPPGHYFHIKLQAWRCRFQQKKAFVLVIVAPYRIHWQLCQAGGDSRGSVTGQGKGEM